MRVYPERAENARSNATLPSIYHSTLRAWQRCIETSKRYDCLAGGRGFGGSLVGGPAWDRWCRTWAAGAVCTALVQVLHQSYMASRDLFARTLHYRYYWVPMKAYTFFRSARLKLGSRGGRFGRVRVCGPSWESATALCTVPVCMQCSNVQRTHVGYTSGVDGSRRYPAWWHPNGHRGGLMLTCCLLDWYILIHIVRDGTSYTGQCRGSTIFFPSCLLQESRSQHAAAPWIVLCAVALKTRRTWQSTVAT